MHIPGMTGRMQKELTARVPKSMQVHVVAPTDGQRMAWRGGSILGDLPAFEGMWITMEEYGETGPTIVHAKCA